MARNIINISFANFNSLIQLTDYFHSEERCRQAIAQERWGDGDAVCPYCGCTHTYECRDGRFLCTGCSNKFSVLVGTIFENTKLPLRKWFMAMYLLSSHSKGISSLQIARDIHVTQKTAWFIMQKLRSLYVQSDETELDGEVEMDEMYLGGREANRHESRRTEGTQGRSTRTKAPIFGMVEREGRIIAVKVEDTRGATLLPIVSQFVAGTASVYTDELSSYGRLGERGYRHETVNHGRREFVRPGGIHTNSIEGFWAHFKRVVFGTYHFVSRDYLQRYIDEQVYRWNTRLLKPSARFHDMFARSVKSFKYTDVLSLSSRIDVEVWKMKHDSYNRRHWAA